MTQPVHQLNGRPPADVRLAVFAHSFMLAEMHGLEEQGLDRCGIALMVGMPVAWVHVLMGPYLPRIDSRFRH